MDALAEVWSRSGRKPKDLYKGKTDEIVKELKTWIVARKARNKANMKLLWDLFETNDAILGLRDQYGTLDDVRIAPFKAKYVKNVERVKEFKKERDKLTLRAEFLLFTLSHRGFQWMRMPCTPQWTEMDSEICAVLNLKDRSFDAERQLGILEMKDEIDEWRLEEAKRKAEEALRVLAGENTDDLPALVDVTGLIPRLRPFAKDSPVGRLSPELMDTIVEESEETEETAEAIAPRSDSVDTTEDRVKAKRKSVKMMNTPRRKDTVGTNAAAKVESASTDNGGDL